MWSPRSWAGEEERACGAAPLGASSHSPIIERDPILRRAGVVRFEGQTKKKKRGPCIKGDMNGQADLYIIPRGKGSWLGKTAKV